MKAIAAVFALFVGAAVAAPQGPGRYQQYRPIDNANYPYRPQPNIYSLTPAQPPVPPQKIYRPTRPQPNRLIIKSAGPTVEATEPPPVQPAVQQFQPNIPPKPYVAIITQSQEDNFDGSFSYSFEAENGISLQVEGNLKDAGTENEAQVIHGTYSYPAPDGTLIKTNWFADDTGFHAEGAHLPVPPPIPDAIAQLLTYNKRSLPQEAEDMEHEQ